MTQAPAPAPTMQSGGPGGARPHRGVMILVFGILGIVCCFIFGIAAWVMGNTDLAQMKAGQMDPSGEGLTTAGKICGIISVVLTIIGVLLNVVWLIMFGGLMWASQGTTP